jgi:hypothetical protein
VRLAETPILRSLAEAGDTRENIRFSPNECMNGVST